MKTFLMAVREDGESEPITVDTDQADAVVLELDDGRVIQLDRAELRAALDDTHSQAA